MDTANPLLWSFGVVPVDLECDGLNRQSINQSLRDLLQETYLIHYTVYYMISVDMSNYILPHGNYSRLPAVADMIIPLNHPCESMSRNGQAVNCTCGWFSIPMQIRIDKLGPTTKSTSSIAGDLFSNMGGSINIEMLLEVDFAHRQHCHLLPETKPPLSHERTMVGQKVSPDNRSNMFKINFHIQYCETFLIRI